MRVNRHSLRIFGLLLLALFSLFIILFDSIIYKYWKIPTSTYRFLSLHIIVIVICIGIFLRSLEYKKNLPFVISILSSMVVLFSYYFDNNSNFYLFLFYSGFLGLLSALFFNSYFYKKYSLNQS